jgi:ABC-type multidrug transport system ATPase subunit
VTKRAWAARGANLGCTNGEILLLLGEEGAGKSRLMTSIAESIVGPTRRALTTTRVRGSITLGGLEVTKWDKVQLRKRFGLLLHDVRTVADMSKALSGWTLEEVLEPSTGLRSLESSRKEKNCVAVALKITGLYSSLLPRLPSKMSTVVTANEEDLQPSALRPRHSILSPAQWGKILCARVLAQTIYDNDNAAGDHEHIENCLMGSLLVLDDFSAHFSEIDEAALLEQLRRTGAATVVSSNRWATGRFADRIAVVRDGSIVETGTHSELLNRGPQQSIYAAKWHALTSQ